MADTNQQEIDIYFVKTVQALLDANIIRNIITNIIYNIFAILQRNRH